MISEEFHVPESLSSFMYAVMEEARRTSLHDVLEDMGITDDDYEEIRLWFKQFGVTL